MRERIADIRLRECPDGEEGLFTRDGAYLLNPHNHTTDSDGAHDLSRVAGFAAEHGVNIAVTEHNLPPRRLAPGLVAGMEVLTKEGVDVVVLGALAKVRRLFEERVRPGLKRRNPQYRPVDVPVAALLEAVEAHGLWASHPHYATVEGLSMLSPDAQRAVLETARGRTFVELNALVGARARQLAEELAQEWDVPLLTSGDTHLGEHQHVGNFSSVPASAVDEGEGALAERLLKAMHARTDRSDDRLLEPGWGEKLLIGANVAKANGPRVIGLYAAKAAGRMLGILYKADERNIPRRTGPKTPRTVQAAPS